MRELLVRICIVAALATSGCGAKDTDKSDCRAERGACAVTADCCDGLICDKHACTTPGASMMNPSPVCGNGSCEAGESGATCCSDCGCPSGKQCKANSCQSDGTGGAMCGNGKCEVGENSSTCCDDCGCAAGLVCQANQCKSAGTTLTWSITNRCFNGEDIEFRFFSRARSWTWPGGGLVFVSQQGAVNSQPVSCNAGELVCFGGDQPRHNLFWGVGISGDQGCSNCCFTCANQSVSMPTLICN